MQKLVGWGVLVEDKKLYVKASEGKGPVGSMVMTIDASDAQSLGMALLQAAEQMRQAS